MTQDFTMLKLSEYLNNHGWDIINDKFYLNEKENTYIKIENNKLHYFVKNEEITKIPLVYILHHKIKLETKDDYDKVMRLINILDNRRMKPFYQFHQYKFKEFPNEYWAFQDFFGILIYIEDGIIECDPDNGISLHLKYVGENLYLEDEVVKNILIELSLKLNPDFFFEYKNGEEYKKEKFEIDFKRKGKIIDKNRDSWEHYS